jgi:hypothetical protein
MTVLVNLAVVCRARQHVSPCEQVVAQVRVRVNPSIYHGDGYAGTL